MKLDSDMTEAFLVEMQGKQYGVEELFDALSWFSAGWEAREKQAIKVTREKIAANDPAYAPDVIQHPGDKGETMRTLAVAGISSPKKRHWTASQRAKFNHTCAKKKRTFTWAKKKRR